MIKQSEIRISNKGSKLYLSDADSDLVNRVCSDGTCDYAFDSVGNIYVYAGASCKIKVYDGKNGRSCSIPIGAYGNRFRGQFSTSHALPTITSVVTDKAGHEAVRFTLSKADSIPTLWEQ